MASSLDDEIRAAAVAQVRRLRDLYGGRIPRSALMEGISVRGQRIPIWTYQKGIFKPAALGRDGAALSVQTSVESPYDDVHDSDAGKIVYKYRGENPSHPDNVALRTALAERRPLIYLVAVDTDPMRTAARREYATRAVLQRLHQQQFRRMVLVAYREQCCICRWPNREFLAERFDRFRAA